MVPFGFVVFVTGLRVLHILINQCFKQEVVVLIILLVSQQHSGLLLLKSR